MKSIPRDTIEKSLSEKGFVKEEGSNHRIWYYWYEGKKTKIRTPISRGTGYKDYTPTLLKMMKPQLYLDSSRQLEDLLRCPMDEKKYTKLMLDKGVVRI